MSKVQAKAGKSLEAFRAAHDKNYIVPTKIKVALAKLGAEGWEYEVDFMKLAQLSTTDLANFREQFTDHVVEVGGRNAKRVWVGTKSFATKLREMT